MEPLRPGFYLLTPPGKTPPPDFLMAKSTTSQLQSTFPLAGVEASGMIERLFNVFGSFVCSLQESVVHSQQGFRSPNLEVQIKRGCFTSKCRTSFPILRRPPFPFLTGVSLLRVRRLY